MVDIKNIRFAYGKGGSNILNDISFHMDDGQCTAILGVNGAGKSTLLKCIDRILRPQGGSVLVDGKDVFSMGSGEMARNIAYVAQNARSVDMTVFDTVLLGRKPYIQWDATAQDRQIAMDMIHRMKLDDFVLRNMTELSGGEAQKVMLARALAQQPRLLLLDEPTSNLDPRNQHEVLRTVREIARENNICVITVLHDLNLAIRYCDRFLFLKDAQLYSYGGMEAVTPDTIGEVYDMHVHIIEAMGIPFIVPFPDEKVEHHH